MLPIIRIYLVNYKKSCWKPFQTLKPIGVQYSVTLRNKCSQTDASEDSHHCIALHPESFHLWKRHANRVSSWLVHAINQVFIYFKNILHVSSCLCLCHLGLLNWLLQPNSMSLYFSIFKHSSFPVWRVDLPFWIHTFFSILQTSSWTLYSNMQSRRGGEMLLLNSWCFLPCREAPVVLTLLASLYPHLFLPEGL